MQAVRLSLSRQLVQLAEEAATAKAGRIRTPSEVWRFRGAVDWKFRPAN